MHHPTSGVDCVKIAVPWCRRCNVRIKPDLLNCPRCGAPVMFRFVKRESAEVEGKGEYIRPRFAT